MKYYPSFLDLRGRGVLIVGGNGFAHERAVGLRDAGARLRIVAPEVSGEMPAFLVAHRNEVDHRPRSFRPTDLDGIWFVVVTEEDAGVQQEVYEVCCDERIFCNVVDVVPRCSWIAPAVVRRGEVTVAVSTGGQSPALAQRLRREIEEIVGEEYGELARILGRLRPTVKRSGGTFQERAEIFRSLIDDEILEAFREGRRRKARREIMRRLGRLLPDREPSNSGLTPCGR